MSDVLEQRTDAILENIDSARGLNDVAIMVFRVSGIGLSEVLFREYDCETDYSDTLRKKAELVLRHRRPLDAVSQLSEVGSIPQGGFPILDEESVLTAIIAVHSGNSDATFDQPLARQIADAFARTELVE